MPIATQIDVDSLRVTQTASGTITPADVIAAIEGQFAHPDFQHRMGILWDFTEATLAFEAQDVLELTRLARSHWDPEQSARTAILARSNTEFGLARMFQGNAQAHGRVIGVFRDREQAMAWLRSAPE